MLFYGDGTQNHCIHNFKISFVKGFDPIYIIQTSYSFTFCKINSAILPDDAGGFSESMFLSEVSHNVDVESVRS